MLMSRVFSPLKTLANTQTSLLVNGMRNLHLGAVLSAEPLKKKKRADPQQELNRVRRKSKRIEREIKRLEKQGKKLKPVEEIEGDRQLFKEERERCRPQIDLSESEVDRKALLQKEWTRYQWSVLHIERQQLARARSAQKRALDLLLATAPDLYKAVIQTDNPADSVTTLPLHFIGPYETPPPSTVTKNEELYEAPDGEIIDTTPNFQYDFEIDRRFMSDVKKSKFVLIKAASTKIK